MKKLSNKLLDYIALNIDNADSFDHLTSQQHHFSSRTTYLDI